MKETEKISKAYNQISRAWEKEGLDFGKAILLFEPPPESTNEEKSVDQGFKYLAKRQIDLQSQK